MARKVLPPETLADRIKRLRGAEGWDQEVLAEKSGVPYRTLQDIERGATQRPRDETLRPLAAALDVELTVLKHGSDEALQRRLKLIRRLADPDLDHDRLNEALRLWIEEGGG